MTRWEYIIVKLNPWFNEDQIEAFLNDYGAEGWEYVDISDGNAVFKRPAGEL